MTLKYLPDARLEVLHIIEWYFGQEKSLAAEVDIELRQAERNIIDFPEFWPPVGGGYHRYLMKRFPYSVVYRIEGETIVIMAIAGHKQQQGYWRKRSKS